MKYMVPSEKGEMVMYRPSETERKLLTAFAEVQGRFDTDTDWAKAAGVSKAQLSKAKRKHGFQALLRDSCIGMVWGSAPAIVRQSIEQALGDSFNDRKLLLDILGVYVPPKARQEAIPPAPIGFAVLLQQVQQQRGQDESIEAEVRELPPPQPGEGLVR